MNCEKCENISTALEMGHFNCFSFLIKKGGDPEIDKFLFYNDDVRFIRLLLEYGANPNAQNEDGDTPAHTCIRLFSEYGLLFSEIQSSINLLWEAGADFNLKNEEGDTVLHLLVRESKYIPGILWFIHRKADPRIKNTEGKDSFSLASKKIRKIICDFSMN